MCHWKSLPSQQTGQASTLHTIRPSQHIFLRKTGNYYVPHGFPYVSGCGGHRLACRCSCVLDKDANLRNQATTKHVALSDGKSTERLQNGVEACLRNHHWDSKRQNGCGIRAYRAVHSTDSKDSHRPTGIRPKGNRPR